MDQLLLKELDMAARYNDLDFEFQNFMEGGVVGSTIDGAMVTPPMRFWNSKSRSL